MRIRNAAAAFLIAGLVAGTVWWQTDDTWPFAQMRMFPGGGESAISIVRIEATLRDGRVRDMNPFAFHLKRAEIEGQMNRIKADPSMLGDLISAYNSGTPRDRQIIRLRLVRHVSATADSEPSKTELVRWPA